MGGEFGKERVGERGLARAGAADDQDVLALDHGEAEQSRGVGRHDAIADIIHQRVDAGRGLADREAWRQRHRRQHALETLAGAFAVRRQLGGDDRPVGMDLGAAVARDQPDDPLDLSGVEVDVGIDPALAEQVDAQAPVGIDHDLDHAGIAQRGGDGRAECSAQHRPAAVCGRVHHRTPSLLPMVRRPSAICRPTWATKASNRARATARPAASLSASGAWMASS